MDLVGQFSIFFGTLVALLSNPYNWVLLVVSMVLGSFLAPCRVSRRRWVWRCLPP